MRRLNKINKKILIILILFISIGFAYLTRDLSLSGISSIFRNTWDIHFENVQVKSGSVEASTPVIDVDETSVSFYAELNEPGDYYEFTIDAVNEGTIDAMIDTFSSIEIDEEIAPLVEYTITYEDGEALAQYQELNAGDSCVYKIRLYYKLDINEEDLPDEAISLDLTFTVDYIQADSNRIRRRAENTLYHLLKTEYNNGGYVAKYNEEHQDSMDASLSTKDIYYITPGGAGIKERSNVIFANHCWQIIRTTDTGGVKLLYNGEANDNKCLTSRGIHVGYTSSDNTSFSGNNWYGTDYTFNSSTKKFKLSGDIVQETYSESTSPNLIGKYTCKSTDVNNECSTLYLLERHYYGSSAIAIKLDGNSNYSQVGTLQYNQKGFSPATNYDSPAYVGYMYGDDYKIDNQVKETGNQLFNTYGTGSSSYTTQVLNSGSLSTTYWYADSVDYGNSVANKYTLNNPYKVNSTSDYQNLVGKYTFRNTNETYSNSSVMYIAAVDESTMYYIQLYSGNLIADDIPISFGDSVTENANGTYTLNNVTTVSRKDWYLNYNNYNNKYTCGISTTNITCNSPFYLYNTTNKDYKYVYMNGKILIAKNRNNLTLENTLLLRKDEIVKNRNNLSEYKYTCNTDSNICTESTLRMINGFTENGYNYISNYYYGESIRWNGNDYTLENTIGLENYNNLNNINSHRYICLSKGQTSCNIVGYIYYKNIENNSMYYLRLKNGVESIEQAFDNMLKKNTSNSTIKTAIDAWYKKYMLEYDSFIEDTIFCNNRTINDYHGWVQTGDITNSLIEFGEYDVSENLKCENITDRFSVNNNQAKLKYKVGLISIPEYNILGSYTLQSNKDYWTISPYYFVMDRCDMRSIGGSGAISFGDGIDKNGVRPAISLKSTTTYSSGDGTMESPYVIDTN